MKQVSVSRKMPLLSGVTDFDAVRESPCFFTTAADPANRPEGGSWWLGLNFWINDSWMTKIAISIGSYADVWIRSVNNGTTVPWRNLHG